MAHYPSPSCRVPGRSRCTSLPVLASPGPSWCVLASQAMGQRPCYGRGRGAIGAFFPLKNPPSCCYVHCSWVSALCPSQLARSHFIPPPLRHCRAFLASIVIFILASCCADARPSPALLGLTHLVSAISSTPRRSSRPSRPLPGPTSSLAITASASRFPAFTTRSEQAPPSSSPDPGNGGGHSHFSCFSFRQTCP